MLSIYPAGADKRFYSLTVPVLLGIILVANLILQKDKGSL